MKEAAARIKINKLLENAGWRFFADAKLTTRDDCALTSVCRVAAVVNGRSV